MSLIGYKDGVLIADRNCEERDAGITFSQKEMIKIHKSGCGSVVAACCGDIKDPNRTRYLLDLVAAKLRTHSVSNEGCVLKSSIVLGGADDVFGLDANSWIFMTDEDAYVFIDEQLIPIPEGHLICNGTMRASLHLLVLNDIDLVDAANRTLAMSACSNRTLDVIKQVDLPPMCIDAEVVSMVEKINAVMEGAKK